MLPNVMHLSRAAWFTDAPLQRYRATPRKPLCCTVSFRPQWPQRRRPASNPPPLRTDLGTMAPFILALSPMRVTGAAAPVRGAFGLVPDVVGDGRGRHGEARFADEGCSSTDHASAQRPGTEVNICGKRRRWTAEQKRQIVAEAWSLVCRQRWWLASTASAPGSFMPGGNSCCCAVRSMPEPTACQMWRALMRRRAGWTWSS